MGLGHKSSSIKIGIRENHRFSLMPIYFPYKERELSDKLKASKQKVWRVLLCLKIITQIRSFYR